MLVDVVAIPPSGSPFFKFVQDNPGLLDQLPGYVHRALVRALSAMQAVAVCVTKMLTGYTARERAAFAKTRYVPKPGLDWERRGRLYSHELLRIELTLCNTQQPTAQVTEETPMTRTVSESTEDVPDAKVKPRTGLPVDRKVFAVAAALAVAFVLWGAIAPEKMGDITGKAMSWVTGSFGWLFILTSGAFVAFSAYLALSRYGNIKLGPDDSVPEFSKFSWVSMMFATGMGIGLMFYGVAEPLFHLNDPPMGMAEPGTPAAAQLAMEYTFFHWGFHPWAMYAVIGLSIGYFAYRKGHGNLVSGAFRPLLGNRVDRAPGKAIDVVAIFATLFGSATSLGLGALQITGGIDEVFGSGRDSKLLAVGVIVFLTACFVVSAVSGIERGVKWLSNANAAAAALLALFLFVVGPTVFILGTFTESLGGYLTQLPAMSFRDGVFDAEVASPVVVRVDDLLLGVVDLVDALRGHVHRPDLERPHDPRVRGLRDPGAKPGVVRLVLDPWRLGVRPAAEPRERHGCGGRRGNGGRALRDAR